MFARGPQRQRQEGAAGKGRRDSSLPLCPLLKQRKQGLGRQVGASRLGGGPTGGLPGPRPSLATVPSGAAGASRPEPSRSADTAKIPASSSSGGRAPCRRAALHSALLTRPCPAVSGQVSAPPSVQEQPLDLQRRTRGASLLPAGTNSHCLQPCLPWFL